MIPAGAKVIMQVHYNMSAGFTAPDATTVSLSTVAEPPPLRLKQRPMFNLDFVVPAGEARSVHTNRTPHAGLSDWTGVAVLPHMHLLGEEIKLEVVHPDGSRTVAYSEDSVIVEALLGSEFVGRDVGITDGQFA